MEEEKVLVKVEKEEQQVKEQKISQPLELQTVEEERIFLARLFEERLIGHDGIYF